MTAADQPVDPEGLAEFLATPRLGILTTRRQPAFPVSVPVWFHWTGAEIQMFSSRTSPKVGRLELDPAASLLVANAVGEPEHWVAFDGTIRIEPDGGIELAGTLAARYWNLQNPTHRATLDTWQAHPEVFCLLRLKVERIRTGS